MFWISGVWDASMKHRLIGFGGIMSLVFIAYIGSILNGTPILIRLIF
jgi:hypothetical protein